MLGVCSTQILVEIYIACIKNTILVYQINKNFISGGGGGGGGWICGWVNRNGILFLAGGWAAGWVGKS